jgi:hypothetical protein
LSDFVCSAPVSAFVGGLLPSMLLGLGLYAQVVGGFTKPSRLGA